MRKKDRPNTQTYWESGMFHVKLYNTNIVAWNSDHIVLTPGNINTDTTRRRMNQTAVDYNLDFRVSNKKHCFTAEYRGKTYVGDHENAILLIR